MRILFLVARHCNQLMQAKEMKNRRYDSKEIASAIGAPPFAVNKLLASGKKEITEKDITENLYTAEMPEPELMIRTGGEIRISNFLLWQGAYSELYFTDVLWPDFSESDVDKAIDAFYKRTRRFGAVV